jgi:hypothetical protein
MVNRVEKIIGSAEKNRVGREPEPQVFFFTPYHKLLPVVKLATATCHAMLNKYTLLPAFK